MPDFKCTREGKCFGRRKNGICDVLTLPIHKDKCPFQKPFRFAKEDGSRYDFVDRYGIYGMKFEPEEGDSDGS